MGFGSVRQDPVMRVLVCGGRSFDDWELICHCLDNLNPSEICHGGAAGVDSLAQKWADERGVQSTVFEANWAAEGRSAGPTRNKRMLDEWKPDRVIAFSGGKGTADMVRRARSAGLRVHTPGWL